MTSRVSSENKEKKAKRKNCVKKRDQAEKKNGTKKQKTASPGVEPGLSTLTLTMVNTANENIKKDVVGNQCR